MKKAVESDYKSEHSIFNLGVSGEDITGVSNRFESEILSRIGRKNETPDHIFIIVAVGVNDTQVDVTTGEHRTEPEIYQAHLEQMVIYAKEQCAGVILLGLAPIDDTGLDPIPWHSTHAYRNSEVKKYNKVIENVAQANDISFISLNNIFGNKVTELTVDGIHPNAEGHRLIFERVKEALEKEGILS